MAIRIHSITGRPVPGVVALVLTVYLGPSDALIRYYDLPSLLHLLAIPLPVAVLVEWRRGGLKRLSPLAVMVTPGTCVVVFVSSILVELPAARAGEAPTRASTRAGHGWLFRIGPSASNARAEVP